MSKELEQSPSFLLPTDSNLSSNTIEKKKKKSKRLSSLLEKKDSRKNKPFPFRSTTENDDDDDDFDSPPSLMGLISPDKDKETIREIELYIQAENSEERKKDRDKDIKKEGKERNKSKKKENAHDINTSPKIHIGEDNEHDKEKITIKVETLTQSERINKTEDEEGTDDGSLSKRGKRENHIGFANVVSTETGGSSQSETQTEFPNKDFTRRLQILPLDEAHQLLISLFKTSKNLNALISPSTKPVPLSPNLKHSPVLQSTPGGLTKINRHKRRSLHPVMASELDLHLLDITEKKQKQKIEQQQEEINALRERVKYLEATAELERTLYLKAKKESLSLVQAFESAQEAQALLQRSVSTLQNTLSSLPASLPSLPDTGTNSLSPSSSFDSPLSLKQENISPSSHSKPHTDGKIKNKNKDRDHDREKDKENNKSLDKERETLMSDPGCFDIEDESIELRKRKQVIQEIVETEQTYVHHLELVIRHFLEPLRDGNLLKAEHHALIFSNLEDIYQLNLAFSKKLEQLDENGHDLSENLGTLFTKLANDLHLYTQYCNHQACSTDLLKKLIAKEHNLANWLEDQKAKIPELNRLDLPSFLIKPVQRICKYPLLLRGVLNHTMFTNKDSYDINYAIKKLNDVVLQINHCQFAYSKTSQLNDQIYFPHKEAQILTPNRFFRKEGKLSTLSDKGKKQTAICVLFNDAFLLLRPAGVGSGGKKYRFEHLITLTDLVPPAKISDDDMKFSFRITTNDVKVPSDRKFSMIFQAKSGEERDSWVSNISSCLKELTLTLTS